MTIATHNLPWTQRKSEHSAFTGSRDFHTIFELTNFVSGEIRASGQRYSVLAEKAGVCASTVSKLAHGETQQPRAATLLQILKALGFTVSVRG